MSLNWKIAVLSSVFFFLALPFAASAAEKDGARVQEKSYTFSREELLRMDPGFAIIVSPDCDPRFIIRPPENVDPKFIILMPGRKIAAENPPARRYNYNIIP
jgi:hypothetical protein